MTDSTEEVARRKREQRREKQKRDRVRRIDREWQRLSAGDPLTEKCGGCDEGRFFPVYQTPRGPRCRDCFVWDEQTAVG